jgi:hypothetical protein
MPWRLVTGTCYFHVDMTFSRKWLQIFSPRSSSTRQRFPLHHDKCQAQIDTVFYSVLCWLYLSFCLLTDNFKIRRLIGIFSKINLEQTGLSWINIPSITIDNNFILHVSASFEHHEVCLKGATWLITLGRERGKGLTQTIGIVYLILAQQPPVGQGILIHEVSRSHTTTHYSR